jgi:hypothetical protein
MITAMPSNSNHKKSNPTIMLDILGCTAKDHGKGLSSAIPNLMNGI